MEKILQISSLFTEKKENEIIILIKENKIY